MAQYIDFKELRQQVSMEMILDHYGLLVTMIKTKDGLKSACPIHNGNPKNKSFKVTPSKNLWKCFSPKCNKGGNVLDFVATMEDCSIREAAEKLVDWFNLGASSGQKTQKSVNKQNTVAGTSREEVIENKPLTFKLKDLQTDHSYFKKNGLTKEIVSNFGLGYYSGNGMMKNKIVIPFHNTKGELIAYIGRSPDRKISDLYPKNFNPEIEIYNLFRIPDFLIGDLYIFLDYVDLWKFCAANQNTIDRSIAFPSHAISPRQTEMLSLALKHLSTRLVLKKPKEKYNVEKVSKLVYDLAKIKAIEISSLFK